MGPVRLIKTRRFGDDRGWFAETFSERSFAGLRAGERFVQDNHSLSRPVATVRGLHFQGPPHAQAKLVRCLRGRILDVAVDIRRGSPTFGRYVMAELSGDNGDQLFVPVGFAHGFLTLEPDTEVTYKVSAFYDAGAEGGVRWDDPGLAIKWPVAAGNAVLSAKDASLPALDTLASPFDYDGVPLTPLDA